MLKMHRDDLSRTAKYGDEGQFQNFRKWTSQGLQVAPALIRFVGLTSSCELNVSCNSSRMMNLWAYWNNNAPPSLSIGIALSPNHCSLPILVVGTRARYFSPHMGALHRANLAVGLSGGNHIHPHVPSTTEVSDYSALAKRSPGESSYGGDFSRELGYTGALIASFMKPWSCSIIHPILSTITPDHHTNNVLSMTCPSPHLPSSSGWWASVSFYTSPPPSEGILAPPCPCVCLGGCDDKMMWWLDGATLR